MFGKKKAERIRQLEESLADKDRLFNIQQTGWRESNEKLAKAQNQIEYLVRTIRDMDQEIWNMSQRTDWQGMRPYFQKLCEAMTARKVAESNRIGDIMRQELIATYTPRGDDGPKKITKA